MPAPYPLLEIDLESPPPDVREEIPCPMLGADPAEKELTSRVAYVLTRVDGMTSLGDLLQTIPLPPRVLIEALLLLHSEGLVGFSPEFVARYLKPRAPVARTTPQPVRAITSPMPVVPVQITVAPGTGDAGTGEARGVQRPATFTIAPPSSEPPPSEPPPSEPPPKSPERAKAAAPTETLTTERSGSIDARPLARLARHLAAARYAGVLTLRRGKVTKKIVFMGGEAAQAHSDAPEEDLGELMHKRGKMDEKAFIDYRSRRKKGQETGAALIEMGAMSAVDMARADRWRAQAVLFDALLWRDGTYEIGEPGALPADPARYDLGLANLVLKAWREAPFDEARKKFFDQHRNWYLIPAQMTDDAIAKMRLNPKEERLLQALREQARRIRDIFEITSLFITETYKFVDGLLGMGLAELSEKNPTESGPLDTKELHAHFETMEAGNFFDRLSAHPISTDEDIEEARKRMLARYEPKHYSNLRPETRETLVKMVRMVEEAYEHLKDGRQRKEYRNKQYDRSRLEYFAEIQFRKGEIFLFWRDDAKTAFAIFESSYEMCPDVSLYAASYALSAVRAFPADRKLWLEAKQILERVLSRPGLPPKVIVIAAAAARAMGDVGRSEQLCQTALKASGNAPDIVQLVEQVRRRGEASAPK